MGCIFFPVYEDKMVYWSCKVLVGICIKKTEAF